LRKNEALRQRVEEDLAAIKKDRSLVRSFFMAPSVSYASYLLVFPAVAQQFTLRHRVVTDYPTQIWTGTNAPIIAGKLLTATNGDGNLLFPTDLLTNRITGLNVSFIYGASNQVVAIRAVLR